jgi:hypothetical protein
VYTRDMSDTDTSKPPEPSKDSGSNPKPKKTIPIVSVPDDRDMLAEEMAELFDEDKVTHKHGSSEPEAD